MCVAIAVEEPAVVRDHDGAAGEVEQRLLERAQRVDVEVVGRLVEQQQVAARAQELREVDAVALAAGELADALLLVGAAEVEPARRTGASSPRACRARSMSWPPEISFQTVFAGVERRRGSGRRRRARRSRRARASPASGFSWPAIMRNSVVLPAPFGPITPTIPPGGRSKVRSSTAAGRRSPSGRCSASTTTSPSRGPAGMWISTRVEPRRSAPPRAASRTRRGAPSTSRGAPSGDMRTHSSSRCERAAARGRPASPRRASRSSFCSSHERVVALERDAPAAVELEDPAGDVVEEVAVVGHRDDGARVVREVALEPGDRLGVEMVRRLVEEQQVGRREQQPAERDAAPLAAGERRRRRGRRRGSGARPSRGRACGRGSTRRRGRSGPAPRLLGEQRVQVGVGLGERRRDRVEAVEQVAQLARRRPRRCRGRPSPGRAPAPARAARRSRSGASSATPEDGSSSPAMIRSSVDLPAPFGPSTPIFAPGRNDSEMFVSTCRSGP